MKARNVLIYEIGDDVKDWVAARSLVEARAGYVEMYGQEQLDDALAAGLEFRVLAPREMDTFRYRDGEGGGITFAEQLQKMKAAGEKFPTHFACSEI